MTVIPSVFEATQDISALTLARYAQIIRYDEAAFFGVNAPGIRERDCRKIWVKRERDQMARYFGEAQAMIENVLMFPIGQKWYEGEAHRNTNPRSFFTDWAHVQALGTKATSTIASGVALNHTNDPATLPATPTTVANADEIHFYQAGTDVELLPNSLTLSGGNVSATFPRARLVLEAFQDNPDTGLDYSDTSNTGPFTQTVDIKRIYTDTSDVGEFVWPLGRTYCTKCGEDTESACGYIQSDASGIISFLRTDAGVCSLCGTCARNLRINYVAGKPIDAEAEDAILHLAHALMPVPPCPSCDPIMMLWKQDQNTPEVLTRARIDCPFGVHDGAWRAWTYAVRSKHFRTPII